MSLASISPLHKNLMLCEINPLSHNYKLQPLAYMKYYIIPANTKQSSANSFRT